MGWWSPGPSCSCAGSTTDGEGPYRASAEGHELAVRVNDFPAEPLYSLFVDDEHAADLEDWPPVWVKPG